MNNTSNSTAKSPKVAIILLGALALFQLMRISAFSMIQDVLAGKTPEAWLFPASTDVAVGVAALFVAIALWRGKGLAVWTGAIVFFCISISDHLDAITVALFTKVPLPASMGSAPSSTAIMLAVMTLVEIAGIVTLATKSLRDHYLAPKSAK